MYGDCTWEFKQYLCDTCGEHRTLLVTLMRAVLEGSSTDRGIIMTRDSSKGVLSTTLETLSSSNRYPALYKTPQEG